MFSCKEITSLSVLSLYEGELIGKVDRLYFEKNLKKINCLGLVGTDGSKWLIPSKSIYHIGPNAITIKNKQAVMLEISSSIPLNSPMNSKAYSIKGEYLGTISDISFNDKYLTTKIYLDNGKTEAVEDVTSCGKSTVIFSKERINPKSLSPKPELETSKVVSTSLINPEQVAVVTKSNLDPNQFLVGRRCIKDIMSFNNEILIKANTTITKKHISQIKKFGKLKELMLYSV